MQTLIVPVALFLAACAFDAPGNRPLPAPPVDEGPRDAVFGGEATPGMGAC